MRAHTQKHTETHRGTQIYNEHWHTEPPEHADTQIDRWTYRQTQTDGLTDGQVDRQMDRWANGHTVKEGHRKAHAQVEKNR